VYQDLWDEARATGSPAAPGYLRSAIAEYVRGFESDWRDAYPGINAATLLDVEGSDASLAQRDRLVPVIRFSVERRLSGRLPDYWDHATFLELSVLANDRQAAELALGDAVASMREPWEAATTARNVTLVRDARRARGDGTEWLDRLIQTLSSESTGPRKR
jgi:hypothetical protein